MLVEVNIKGKSHVEHAPKTIFSKPCPARDITFGGRCLNCGWHPDHVQERGAEIVVHYSAEGLPLLQGPHHGERKV